MRLSAQATLLFLAAALGACDTERRTLGFGKLPSGPLYADAGVASDARDATATSVSSLVAEPLGTRLGCGSPCASKGVTSSTCVEGIAVQCIAGRIACDDCPGKGRDCRVEGATVACRLGCEGDSVTQGNETFTRVCCPGATWCEGDAQARCDAAGLAVSREPCVKGLECYDGHCLPARPMVLVLFDTSASMGWSALGKELDSVDELRVSKWPACELPTAPLTRLGISKRAWADLFSEPVFDTVAFALQRFPQHLLAGKSQHCPGGGYTPADLLTGHPASTELFSVPDDASGAWFRDNLAEALLVPFPVNGPSSNRDSLRAWVDFNEKVVDTDTPCTTQADCPNGSCAQKGTGDDHRCTVLENPELRPTGATPLGLSLFYAGEYFRKFAVLEGAPCHLDADCPALGHLCDKGKCHDPNRFCRQRSVVMFTDGIDTASEGAWVAPSIQAKRFRYGLDCKTDQDCGKGATCASSGTCQPASEALDPCKRLGFSCHIEHEDRTFPKAFAAGFTRLRDRLGAPIRITVHVVDATGAIGYENATVAAYGGGLLVPADLASPADLLKGIRGVIDWKDANFCDPE